MVTRQCATGCCQCVVRAARSEPTFATPCSSVAAAITTVGTVFAEPMLVAMQTPAALMADATAFLRVTFWAAPITMAFNYLAAIIRALGAARDHVTRYRLKITLRQRVAVIHRMGQVVDDLDGDRSWRRVCLSV